MRRRGRNSNIVSLFAFQDVMASVIGILFMVVVLMALDIIRAKSPATVPDPGKATDELQTLRENARKLERKVASLRKTAERNVEKVNLASQSETEILDVIRRLHRTLKAKHELIKQGNRDLAKLDAIMASKRREFELKRSAAQVLKARLSKLKKQVKPEPSVPRIAYIIDPMSQRIEPWLVEVSKNAIRAASKDGSSAVLAFEAKSSEARKRHLLAWAKTQSARTHYFVLLIKPSGIELAREIGSELQKRGFHIGTDLLPEDWRAFD